MDNSEFRAQAHKLVDWMADYLVSVGQLPLKRIAIVYPV